VRSNTSLILVKEIEEVKSKGSLFGLFIVVFVILIGISILKGNDTLNRKQIEREWDYVSATINSVTCINENGNKCDYNWKVTYVHHKRSYSTVLIERNAKKTDHSDLVGSKMWVYVNPENPNEVVEATFHINIIKDEKEKK
jgi:hypothetical protein